MEGLASGDSWGISSPHSDGRKSVERGHLKGRQDSVSARGLEGEFPPHAVTFSRMQRQVEGGRGK